MEVLFGKQYPRMPRVKNEHGYIFLKCMSVLGITAGSTAAANQFAVCHLSFDCMENRTVAALDICVAGRPFSGYEATVCKYFPVLLIVN